MTRNIFGNSTARALVLVALTAATALSPGEAQQIAAQPTTGPDTLFIYSESMTRERQGDDWLFILQGDVRVLRRGIEIRSRRARKQGARGDEHIFFYENVRIDDGSIEMTGDNGEFHTLSNQAALAGNVVIRDSTGVITAGRTRWERTTGVLRLWDDVDFRDPKTRVQADSIVYDRNKGLGEAFGHVVLTDLESGSVARGSHGFYDRNRDATWLDRQPVVELVNKGDTRTRVYADKVTSKRNVRAMNARGNVRIERGNTVATSDSAVLHDEGQRLELRGRPVVQRGAARISGREIDAYFDDVDVERVVVRRDALLVQARADTSLIRDPNTVAGDSASMFFDEGDLRRAVVSGSASSTFVPVETRADRIALNEARSDSIIMLFKNDDTEEVIFLGNASGTYRFYEGSLDSLRQRPEGQVDTTFGVARGDTTRFDFRRRAEIVQYRGERILYLTAINDLHLQEAAEVQYQNRTLRAGKITFDADTDLLTARENPVLVEGGDRIYGDEMGYDMDKRDAWVKDGATQYDMGYYRGERILRRPDGTLLVTDGHYSTCDLAEPHYSFHSDEMKIYLQDKVIGRPVRLYLGKIPVAYLPFYFNSVNPGRRSGFLQPDIEFGIGSRSRHLRGLDYYWAASDYWDVLFSSEYNERSRPDRRSVAAVLADTAAARSLRLSANLRYKLRYHLDGNVNYSRSDELTSDATFYTLSGTHMQDFSDNTKLRGSLDFASSDRALRASYANTSYKRARERQLTSTLAFNHRRPLFTMNMNLNRIQRLNPEPTFFNQPLIQRTLPGLSLTFRNIRFAPRPRNPQAASWLQNFLSDLQYSPAVQLSRKSDDIRRRRFVDPVTGTVYADTTGLDSLGIDPSQLRTEFFTETFETWTAATGVGLTKQSRVWIFNLTPGFSYDESFVKSEASTDAEIRDGRFSRSFRTSTSASTDFYGIFRPGIGTLRALRHTIRPRASFSWQPAIAGQQPQTQSVGVQLTNQLDAKVGKAGEERRVDGVIAWDLSSSYNPDRGRREWGPISSHVTLNRQGPVRLDVTQSYDPYTGKITETRIPFSIRLSGSVPGYGVAEDPERRLNRVASEEGVGRDSLAAVIDNNEDDEEDEDGDVGEGGAFGAGRLAWDFSTGFQFTRQNGRTVSARMQVNAHMQPTSKWRISYSATYDPRRREFTSPSIHVERDLHCWKASFARVFDGFDREWRYYFRIHVVQHQEDLFFESGERQYRSF